MNSSKFILGLILVVALGTTTVISSKSSDAAKGVELRLPASPITSGQNVYIVWTNNNTGHPEVMFRASADGGQSFNYKINLSNSSDTDSTNAAITAEGDSLTVTWWETSESSQEPVARTSTDNGKTFGAIMSLASNGTIGVR